MAIAAQTPEIVAAGLGRGLGWRTGTAALARRNPLSAVGVLVLLAVLLLTFVAPFFYPFQPLEVDASATLQGPSGTHVLGTDTFGRDILARVLEAGRLDFGIALSVTLLAFTVGSAIGALAGYAGGMVDDVVMRLVELILSFPAFILALALTVTLSARWNIDQRWIVIIAIAIAYSPYFMRLTRGEVLKVRDAEYADAARVVGNPPWRVAYLHVFPNSIAPALVLASLTLGWAILDASALGFLGIGIHPPTAEWGVMISDGTRNITTGEWWTWLFPGLAILLVVLAFNWVGDGLRNLLRTV